MSEGFGQWLSRLFISKPTKELSQMTKIELELLAREHGVELDRRLKKDTLIKQVKKIQKVK